MPIKPCQVRGKKGHRWGNRGKCYTGKGSRARAAKQAAAIRASGWTTNARHPQFLARKAAAVRDANAVLSGGAAGKVPVRGPAEPGPGGGALDAFSEWVIRAV